MIIKSTSEQSAKKRREMLLRLSRLGTLLIAQYGVAVAANLELEKIPSNTKTGESETNEAVPKNPKYLVAPDVTTATPIDHLLFNPSTKRKIGIRIRVPTSRAKTGLIIYSPGLGSGLNNGAPWCDA